MRIEDLKRWHWCILGILAGLAMAYTWSNMDVAQGRTTSQNNFERGLSIKNANGDPQLRNIVIYPPNETPNGEKVSLVTFDWLTQNKGFEYIKHSFNASIPYKPTPFSGLPARFRGTPAGPIEVGDKFLLTVTTNTGRSETLEYSATGTTVESVTAGIVEEWKKSKLLLLKMISVVDDKTHVTITISNIGPDKSVQLSTVEQDGSPADGQTFELGSDTFTVTQFLDRMKERNAEISYLYAWYREPKWMYTVGVVGGLVVIGGIWPTLLNLMIGAGFGRPPREKDEYDLDRFKGEPEPEKAPAPTGLTDADRKQLAELEAELAKKVGDGTVATATATAEETQETEIRKLDARPAEPLPPPPVQPPPEKKEYRGEYYPTAKGKPKD
jgi:hypothetical protein